MSMKALVNNLDVYNALQEFVQSRISVLQTSLEQATEPASVYRLQGQITALRRFKTLRDEVNYKDKSHG